MRLWLLYAINHLILFNFLNCLINSSGIQFSVSRLQTKKPMVKINILLNSHYAMVLNKIYDKKIIDCEK